MIIWDSDYPEAVRTLAPILTNMLIRAPVDSLPGTSAMHNFARGPLY